MKILSIVFLICSVSVFAQQIDHHHDVHYGFIENKGQWNEDVLLKSRFEGGNLWIQQHKMLFHIQDYSELQLAHLGKSKRKDSLYLRQDLIQVDFLASEKITSMIKEQKSKHYYNYFIGNKPEHWASEVHAYAEVTLQNLYPGIHLKYIEKAEQLKYEFHIGANVSPDVIQLKYQGQEGLKIDQEGSLIIRTKLGKIIEEKPYAYQIINGKIKTVACKFHLEKEILSFELGDYNKDFQLIIDPILIFATYSGSVSDNFGMTATYGHDGTAYSAGTVFGNTYPTPDPNAFNTTTNITVVNNGTATTDVFVSKYSADGTAMLWTAFLGGGDDTQGTETAHSLICDKQNNLYIYGATSSLDFPIQNGFQAIHGGGTPLLVSSNGTNFGNAGTDIYVAKISSDGHNLLGSTYMGGSLNDGVNFKISSGNYGTIASYDSLTSNYGDQYRGEIMLDSVGNCLVASCSRSTNFPVLNAVQGVNQGQQDGVIFKLSNDLAALLFSTYIGGSNNDACYSVKIDSSYNIVFAGGTSSPNLPSTFGAWQSSYNGGISDGFVGKLNPAGNVLQRISFVGTPNYDQAFFVEIDRNDQVFLVGQSRGGQFPIFNAAFSNPNSGQFIAKLNADLTNLVSSTQFGSGQGMVDISPSAFLVDICGNIYVSGWGGDIFEITPISGMPVTADAFQNVPQSGVDFYLLVLERDFQSLRYATYLGGSQSPEHVDGGTSRYDKNGVVYQSVCGGCWGFSDFPTTPGAWSNLNLDNTGCNNLVFKFDFGLILDAKFTVDQILGCIPFDVTFQNNSNASDTYLWDFGNGDTSTVIFSPVISYTVPGDYEVTLITLDSVCLLSDTAKTLIHVGLPISYSISNDTTLCSGSSFELLSSSFGTATSYQWSSTINFLDTLNNPISDSTLIINPQNQFETYYLRISNVGCSIIDSVVIQSSSTGLQLTGGAQVCENEDFIVTATNTSSLTYTYLWYPSSLIDNQINATTVDAVTTQPAYLYVDVSASNGCQFTDSILIDVSPINSIQVDATASENIVIPGTQVTLSAVPNGNYSYQWSPTTGLSNPNGQQTNATVNETTTYSVTVTDGTCTATDTVSVLCVSSECKPPNVYIPNAFSPNQMGKNEVFYVRGPQIIKLLFRVYDRWGELVFESTDPNKGWDGTWRDRKCDPDVYDYYIEVTCVGGNTEIIKGNVTLMK